MEHNLEFAPFEVGLHHCDECRGGYKFTRENNKQSWTLHGRLHGKRFCSSPRGFIVQDFFCSPITSHWLCWLWNEAFLTRSRIMQRTTAGKECRRVERVDESGLYRRKCEGEGCISTDRSSSLSFSRWREIPNRCLLPNDDRSIQNHVGGIWPQSWKLHHNYKCSTNHRFLRDHYPPSKNNT